MIRSLTWNLPLCLLLFFNDVFASNYYFSAADGNDARTFAQAENPSTPWKTVDKLNAIFPRLLPGDSIFFKRGEVFDGGILLNRSGLPGHPIVLTAYGEGPQPVINGFATVSAWTSLGSGIYQSDILPTGPVVNLVRIDGRSHAMGRFPNAESDNKGYLTFDAHDAHSITDYELPASPNWTGAELVIRLTRWVVDRTRITGHSGRTIAYEPVTNYAPVDGFGYFIQNDIQTLDQFGEWYYDASTRRIAVYFGEASPGDYCVEVSRQDILVEANASHIELNGLSLSGANRYGFYNEWEDTEDISIKNCAVSFSGIDAIHVSGIDRLEISGCVISHSNNNGITLNYKNTHVLIHHNLIRHTAARVGMSQSGDGQSIGIYGRNTNGLIVEQNVIVNTGHSGIDFSGDSILIKNNYVNTFCTTKDDGGGIYTFTGIPNTVYQSRKIVGNIVVNGVGAPEGADNAAYRPAEGIYLDDNTANVEIVDNTVANCAQNGLYLHNARDFDVKRNTFYNNQVQLATVHDFLAQPITGGNIADNIFLSKFQNQWVASFRSVADDIENIGTLNYNYYARPLDDSFVILTAYEVDSPLSTVQAYDLAGWQATYGQDLASGASPVHFPFYEINSLKSTNKAPNGRFETNIGEAFCFSSSGDCSTSWTSNSVLDGGALEASGDAPLHVVIDFGRLEKQKQYILRFSGAATQEANLEVYLRQRNAPFQILTETAILDIGTESGDYEIPFLPMDSENYAAISFDVKQDHITFWLDNISLYEADITFTNPDDYIRFAYNPTWSDSTVLLEDHYVDVANRIYTEGVVLSPFSSIILLRDTAQSDIFRSDVLTEWSAAAAECEVKLHWRSWSEDNFSHYELEKSEDGLDFRKIAQLPATDGDYQYVDQRPGPLSYYRLKIVDRDGRYRYSELLPVETICRKSYLEWRLYPNPVDGSTPILNIEFYTILDTITLSIVDQTGRIVRTRQPAIKAGWNSITWDVGGLPPGVYFLHSNSVAPGRSGRFVVVKD